MEPRDDGGVDLLLACDAKTTVVAIVPLLPRVTAASARGGRKLPERAAKANVASASGNSDDCYEDDGARYEDDGARAAFVRLSYYDATHELTVALNWITGSREKVRARGAFDM